MALIIFAIMVVLLIIGFPMMMPLIVSTLYGFFDIFNGLHKIDFLIQQIIAGIRPSSLIAIPMFIFASDIMTRGKSADLLITLVMKFVGHLKGGLAVSTSASCTLFGAVSGSTQATVVAVGSILRPQMLKGGYKDSFVMALIINSSDIAFLIPPSIGMIVYGIISKTSIAELFIAGVGPGLLILLFFSIYSVIYAYKHNVPTCPKASFKERINALRQAIFPLGFPFIIIGGIYGGIFSPTEAATVCVLYALILEMIIFRSLAVKDIFKIAKSTGLITAVVFILVGVGSAFAWILSFASVPQEILSTIGITKMSAIGVLFTISIAFFIGCMFVDPIVVILILVPIFAPAIEAAQIDPVLVGIIITLQTAIGSATPPFGCDIFTAIAIFKRPYQEVIRGTFPFILILLLVSVLLIYFPQIALFLRDLAFRG